MPARYRSRILALCYLAQPLTTVLGAPLAGYLMQQQGVFDLQGWRFMFFGVAIPAIVLGVVAWFYLTLINTVGNFAGFVAPYVTGALFDRTGSYVLPMFVVGGFLLLSAVLMVLLGRGDRAGEQTRTAADRSSHWQENP